MKLALRYILLGFLAAIPLQLFANPPTWSLFVAFGAGMIFGMVFTAAEMWACDYLERHDL